MPRIPHLLDNWLTYGGDVRLTCSRALVWLEGLSKLERRKVTDLKFMHKFLMA
jgi:hypothetical protein